MPLFMDRHELESDVTAEDVALAHVEDMQVQDRFGVKYITYWFDYERHAAFCLVDAPDADTATQVHAAAHGLIANEIIPVASNAVEAFLGKIEHPPAPGEVVTDSAFRTILFTDIEGSTALTQRLGDSGAMAVVRAHDEIVRRALAGLEGNKVKHTGDGIMASFESVTRGVECSIAILQGLEDHNRKQAGEKIGVRIGLSAGEPVTEGGDLFGAAVQLASRICDQAEAHQILVSNAVKELAIGKGFAFSDRGAVDLKGFPEPVQIAEVSWR
jgi:class 3 adenylate cyclase